MDAMKAALMNKMDESRMGKKPDLSIKIGMGKPVPDMEQAGDQSAGDPMSSMHDHKKLLEENDLAPESNEHELDEQNMEMGEGSKLDQLMQSEKGEEGMMRQILSALADRSMPGRGSNGLAERAALGAKDKLKSMGQASPMAMKSKY
jgi:hypothetical protein